MRDLWLDGCWLFPARVARCLEKTRPAPAIHTCYSSEANGRVLFFAEFLQPCTLTARCPRMVRKSAARRKFSAHNKRRAGDGDVFIDSMNQTRVPSTTVRHQTDPGWHTRLFAAAHSLRSWNCVHRGKPPEIAWPNEDVLLMPLAPAMQESNDELRTEYGKLRGTTNGCESPTGNRVVLAEAWES